MIMITLQYELYYTSNNLKIPNLIKLIICPKLLTMQSRDIFLQIVSIFMQFLHNFQHILPATRKVTGYSSRIAGLTGTNGSFPNTRTTSKGERFIWCIGFCTRNFIQSRWGIARCFSSLYRCHFPTVKQNKPRIYGKKALITTKCNAIKLSNIFLAKLNPKSWMKLNLPCLVETFN